MLELRVFAAAVAIASALFVSACCRGTSHESPTGTAAGTEGASDGTQAWQAVSSAAGTLEAQVQKNVAAASAQHLRPIVYIGAKWCDPCRAIHRYQSDARMRDAFSGTYVIELDLDDWKEEDLKAMGYRAGAIPVFIAVDTTGHASGPTIDGGAWGDNIPENMAPPLKKFFAGLS